MAYALTPFTRWALAQAQRSAESSNAPGSSCIRYNVIAIALEREAVQVAITRGEDLGGIGFATGWFLRLVVVMPTKQLKLIRHDARVKGLTGGGLRAGRVMIKGPDKAGRWRDGKSRNSDSIKESRGERVAHE